MNSGENSSAPPFHLAIPVHDLVAAIGFYRDILGCRTGRTSKDWVDFDFFGHQLVVHRTASPDAAPREAVSRVDDEDVPVRHFGVVVDRETFENYAARLARAGVRFLIPPTLRHEGRPGEQRTFFVRDPSGNAIEFKCMTHAEDLFAA